MKTIYYVNDKPVSLSDYIHAQYYNTWSELRRYSLERFIKRHPNVIKEACDLPDINSAMNYVISEWMNSKEYEDYMKCYSKSSPEKDAKQYFGCMIVFWIVVTIICIIAFVCEIK